MNKDQAPSVTHAPANPQCGALAVAPGSAIEIPAGWHQIHEGNRVALGDRVWNGRRYTDLTAILGCEKVARGQTVIRNVQMHRAQNGHGPNSFTADGWRTMSPATQQALGEMVKHVLSSPNIRNLPRDE